VAPLFFLSFSALPILDGLFFTQETLQFALREAGRTRSRASIMANPDTSVGGNLSRVDSIKTIAQQKAVGIITDPSQIVVSSGGVTGFAGKSW